MKADIRVMSVADIIQRLSEENNPIIRFVDEDNEIICLAAARSKGVSPYLMCPVIKWGLRDLRYGDIPGDVFIQIDTSEEE